MQRSCAVNEFLIGHVASFATLRIQYFGAVVDCVQVVHVLYVRVPFLGFASFIVDLVFVSVVFHWRFMLSGLAA